MEAIIQKFIEDIQHLSVAELRALCAELKRENEDLQSIISVYRKSDTNIARDYQAAQDKITDLERKLKALQKSYDHIAAQNDLLTRHRFGSHNEKLGNLCSPTDDLIDPLSEDYNPEEDSDLSGRSALEPTQAPKSRKSAPQTPEDRDDRAARSKTRKMVQDILGNGRTETTSTKMDLSRLPHKVNYILDIDENDRLYGRDNWEIVSWRNTEQLHRPLITAYVEETHTPVIKRRDTNELITPSRQDVLLKKSKAAADFVAAIMYDKCFLSTPTYRQSADMENHGLVIPRQDLSNWIVRFAESHLETPYYYMQKLQCVRSYGQCDETKLQVLHEEGRDARTPSFAWVHTTGELDDGPPIVIFSYEPTRGTEHLRKYYADFSGTLTSDAYTSYAVLGKENPARITISGCLMHVRRRYAEALEIIRLNKLKKEQIDALPEKQALVLIGKIYNIEGELKSLSAEDRLSRRQAEVKPIVDEFYQFIESLDISDPAMSEKMKDAVSYSLNQKEMVCRFLEDGRIPCDNGFCENSIRIYAQGRRNWLFANTPRGANAIMTIYSLIETARKNEANPQLYLKYLLEKVPEYLDLPSNSSKLEELMPWSSVYKKYEDDEMSKAMEMMQIIKQEKPPYRPKKKTAA